MDFLVLNGLFGLGSSAVLGGFETANELIGISLLMVRPFEVKTLGVRKAASEWFGLTVPGNATIGALRFGVRSPSRSKRLLAWH